MAQDKKRRESKANTKKPPRPPRQSGFGQAAAAAKNREREARFRIIGALNRLSIPFPRWPDFVQAFYSDPSQRTEYHQYRLQHRSSLLDSIASVNHPKTGGN